MRLLAGRKYEFEFDAPAWIESGEAARQVHLVDEDFTVIVDAVESDIGSVLSVITCGIVIGRGRLLSAARRT